MGVGAGGIGCGGKGSTSDTMMVSDGPGRIGFPGMMAKLARAQTARCAIHSTTLLIIIPSSSSRTMTSTSQFPAARSHLHRDRVFRLSLLNLFMHALFPPYRLIHHTSARCHVNLRDK